VIKIKYIKIILSFFIIVITILLININFNKKDNYLSMTINENIEYINYNQIINNLKNEYNNSDIIGILKINNTLEVPILQTSNNDYYLNHTIKKEENYIGSIFLDYRTNIETDKKLLIYGHSSNMEDITFNILENYYDREYYENHKYINLVTNKEEKTYEIFSVYVEISDFSYMNINFIDSEDYYKHLNNLKSKSLYDTGIEVKEDDEILILQTCSNHIEYSNYDKKYLLIISRRIK